MNNKLKNFIKKYYRKFFNFKIWLYKEVLSDTNLVGSPNINSPTLFTGAGKVVIGENVAFGYYPSPDYFELYTHIEARNKTAEISISDGTIINNHATIIANAEKISIGKNCRIGANFQCFDSDFHGLKVQDRDNPKAIKNKPVKIGDNVFIGNNVIVLKGVSIGNGCVIAGGGIVTSDIPPYLIAAGCPGRVIATLEDEHEQ